MCCLPCSSRALPLPSCLASDKPEMFCSCALFYPCVTDVFSKCCHLTRVPFPDDQCRFLGSDDPTTAKTVVLILTGSALAGAPISFSLFLCVLVSSLVLAGTST